MTTSNPLKWHGGKTYLARRIVELMPPHTHYVEPYFGGGAVLFVKDPEGVSEVVNDINYDLTNFWCALKHEEIFQQFQRIVGYTPFSQWEFDHAKPDSFMAHVARTLGVEEADASCAAQAAAFFIRYRQSRQGLGKDFATLSRNRTRRGMNEQASAWLTAVEGLPEAHARLKRVVILNRDALDVIRQQDGAKTHFYCDPPYLHETRSATDAYSHEMTVGQHGELLSTLGTIKGTFQLSGYRSELYDEVAERFHWRRVDFDLPNNASGKKQKERKTECLWMNY